MEIIASDTTFSDYKYTEFAADVEIVKSNPYPIPCPKARDGSYIHPLAQPENRAEKWLPDIIYPKLGVPVSGTWGVGKRRRKIEISNAFINKGVFEMFLSHLSTELKRVENKCGSNENPKMKINTHSGHRQMASLRLLQAGAISRSFKEFGFQSCALGGNIKRDENLFDYVLHMDYTMKDTAYPTKDGVANFFRENKDARNCDFIYSQDDAQWYDLLEAKNYVMVFTNEQMTDNEERGTWYDQARRCFRTNVRGGSTYSEVPFRFRDETLVNNGSAFQAFPITTFEGKSVVVLRWLGYVGQGCVEDADNFVDRIKHVHGLDPRYKFKLVGRAVRVFRGVCESYTSRRARNGGRKELMQVAKRTLYARGGRPRECDIHKLAVYYPCGDGHFHIRTITEVPAELGTCKPDMEFGEGTDKRSLFVYGTAAHMISSGGHSVTLSVRCWRRLFEKPTEGYTMGDILQILEEYGEYDPDNNYQSVAGSLKILAKCVKEDGYVIPCLDVYRMDNVADHTVHLKNDSNRLKATKMSHDARYTMKHPVQMIQDRKKKDEKTSKNNPEPKDQANLRGTMIPKPLDLAVVGDSSAIVNEHGDLVQFVDVDKLPSDGKKISLIKAFPPHQPRAPKDMVYQDNSVTAQGVEACAQLTQHAKRLAANTPATAKDALQKRLVGEKHTNMRAQAKFTAKSTQDAIAFAKAEVDECGVLGSREIGRLDEILKKSTASGKRKLTCSTTIRKKPTGPILKPNGKWDGATWKSLYADLPLNKQDGFLKKEPVDGPGRIIVDSSGGMRLNGYKFAYALIGSARHNRRNAGRHSVQLLSKTVSKLVNTFAFVFGMDLSKFDATINRKHVLAALVYCLYAFGFDVPEYNYTNGDEDEYTTIWLHSIFSRECGCELEREIITHFAHMFKKKVTFVFPTQKVASDVYECTQSSGDFLTYFLNTKWNEMMAWVWAKDNGYQYGRDYVFLASGDDSLLFTNKTIGENSDLLKTQLAEVYNTEYCMEMSETDWQVTKLRGHFEFDYCGKYYSSETGFLLPHHARWMPKYHILATGITDPNVVKSRCIQLLGKYVSGRDSFMGLVAKTELQYYIKHHREWVDGKLAQHHMSRDFRRVLVMERACKVNELGGSFSKMIESKFAAETPLTESRREHDMKRIDGAYRHGACADFLKAIENRDPREWPKGFFKNEPSKKVKDYRVVEVAELKNLEAFASVAATEVGLVCN